MSLDFEISSDHNYRKCKLLAHPQDNPIGGTVSAENHYRLFIEGAL